MSIDIDTSLVCVFPVRIYAGELQFLVLQRSKKDNFMPNSWHIVYGKIEGSESAVDAVIREVKEEIGVYKFDLLTLNEMFTVFDSIINKIRLIPIFVAILAEDDKVSIDNVEISDYKWLSMKEAEAILTWHNQKDMLYKILRLCSDLKSSKHYRITKVH